MTLNKEEKDFILNLLEREYESEYEYQMSENEPDLDYIKKLRVTLTKFYCALYGNLIGATKSKEMKEQIQKLKERYEQRRMG